MKKTSNLPLYNYLVSYNSNKCFFHEKISHDVFPWFSLVFFNGQPQKIQDPLSCSNPQQIRQGWSVLVKPAMKPGISAAEVSNSQMGFPWDFNGGLMDFIGF